MAKDYAKFVPPKPQQAKYRSWRLALFFVFFLVISCFAAVTYIKYAKNSPMGNQKVAALVEKIVTLLSQHKKETVVALNNTTKAVAKKDLPPAVQFDFYNELPNMQVSLPEIATMSPTSTPAPTLVPKSVAAVAPLVPKSPLVATTTVKLVQETAKTPAVHSEPKQIINDADISGMLAAETQTLQYILELGVFDTESAAKRMLGALSDVGFKAEVVKSNKNGRSVYLLQQGPFPSMTLAKTTQQRLQKRGIISIVRKTM